MNLHSAAGVFTVDDTSLMSQEHDGLSLSQCTKPHSFATMLPGLFLRQQAG